MVFNLKGLMESVRPTQIGIGTLETIQDRFKDDRELDQQRLSNTIDSAGLILEDASKEVALINKRTELYNQTVQTYGAGVADYLAQSKTFALYDDVKNVSAMKDIDGPARNAQRIIAQGGFDTSENPYQFDTRNSLLDNLDKVEAELQSLNNIPDKTGKVAIRRKELEKIKGNITAEVMPEAGVKVSAFPTSMGEAQKTKELAAYLATAISLNIDYMDKDAMAEIGFPAVTLQEADNVLNIGADINKLSNTFGQDFTIQLLQSDNPAEVVAEYQKLYEELLKKSLPTNKTQEDKKDIIDLTPST